MARQPKPNVHKPCLGQSIAKRGGYTANKQRKKLPAAAKVNE
jgi:hypothetical protein